MFKELESQSMWWLLVWLLAYETWVNGMRFKMLTLEKSLLETQ